MCGIVSVFGVLGVDHEKAFRDMLIFDQVRGEHSTGVAFVNRALSNAMVAKAVGTPNNLFELKAFDTGMAQQNRAIIGHNRYATVGKINKANAHPYTFGDVTGVHNGSLRNYSNLDEYGQHEVDSQNLYHHIEAYGLRDAVTNVNGAMALVWWDANTNTVNVFRNDERPLFWARTADDKVVFVASEAWMISVAASRRTVKIGEIAAVPVDMHFQFHIPNNHWKELEKPVGHYIAPREETFSRYAGWWHQQESPTVSPQAAANVLQLPNRTEVKLKDTTFHEFPKGILCQYAEDRVIYGKSWAIFYEVGGDQSREFCMPMDEFKRKDWDVDDMVEGDCNGFINDSASGSLKKYYKLDFDKVSLVAVDDPKEDEFIGDKNGNPMTKDAWYKKYGTCAHCDGDVSHTELKKFGKEDGTVFCEECITSPDVAESLPLSV